MIAQFRNGWLQSEQNAPTHYWNRLLCCYIKVALCSLCEGECSGVDVELLFVIFLKASMYISRILQIISQTLVLVSIATGNILIIATWLNWTNMFEEWCLMFFYQCGCRLCIVFFSQPQQESPAFGWFLLDFSTHTVLVLRYICCLYKWILLIKEHVLYMTMKLVILCMFVCIHSGRVSILSCICFLCNTFVARACCALLTVKPSKRLTVSKCLKLNK